MTSKNDLNEEQILKLIDLNTNGVDKAVDRIKVLKDTFGQFSQIKAHYFNRDKSERIHYLESIKNEYNKLNQEINPDLLLIYIHSNINADCDAIIPLMWFIETTAKIMQFYQVESEIVKQEYHESLFEKGLRIRRENWKIRQNEKLIQQNEKLISIEETKQNKAHDTETVNISDVNNLDNNPDFEDLLFKDDGKNQLHDIIKTFEIKIKSGKYSLTQNKAKAAELIVAIFEVLNSEERITNYCNKNGNRNWKYIIPYFIHKSGDSFTSQDLNKAKDKIIDPTTGEIDGNNKFIKAIKEI